MKENIRSSRQQKSIMIKKKQSSEMVAVFLIPFYSVIFFLKNLIFKMKGKMELKAEKCLRFFFKSLIFILDDKDYVVAEPLSPICSVIQSANFEN